MNIGGRIELRLKELAWGRKDLLDRVPDLTSQALHNLIKRDSVRSEWDTRIADALGVSVLWLVYGVEVHQASSSSTKNQIREANDNVVYIPKNVHPAVQEVVRLMNETDDLGKGMILVKVRDIAKERSKKTNKPQSST